MDYVDSLADGNDVVSNPLEPTSFNVINGDEGVLLILQLIVLNSYDSSRQQ